MHILIVPSWYPNDEKDISGSFFREQAIALAESGHKISVAYVETRSITRLTSDKYKKKWKPCFSVSGTIIREIPFPYI